MDPYEGKPTVADMRMTYADFRTKFIIPGKHPDVDEPTFASMRKAEKVFFADPNRASYAAYYVSCWHQNDSESDAMWKIYATRGDGIAIRTTFGRLKSSIQIEPRPVYVGNVIYVNTYTELTDTSLGSGNAYLLQKTLPYAHEKEVRAAMVLDPKDASPGLFVRADVEVLVERLYLSPTAPEWLAELINKMLKRIGYRFEITPSDYLLPPVY